LGPTRERWEWQAQVQDLQLLITEPRERVLELRLSGDIDLATVEPLRDAARRSAASGDYDALVIDLLGVHFIDSSGLHALMEAHKAMVAAGGTTKVVCAAPNLLKVFELTGLDRVLAIVTDRPEAYAVAA
jgi:anti-sigma B factor antagonist